MRPHRRILWSRIKDFLQDNNGTVSVTIPIAAGFPPLYGSCGLPPDDALMAKEPINVFDRIADEMGWDIPTRRVEYSIYLLIGKTHRMSWLNNQVSESLRTNSAPLSKMTAEETSWFLRELKARKDDKKKRLEQHAAYQARQEMEKAAWRAGLEAQLETKTNGVESWE